MIEKDDIRDEITIVTIIARCEEGVCVCVCVCESQRNQCRGEKTCVNSFHDDVNSTFTAAQLYNTQQVLYSVRVFSQTKSHLTSVCCYD